MAEAPDLASWIVVGGIAGLCYGWFCTRAGFSGAAPLLEAVGWDQSGKRAPGRRLAQCLLATATATGAALGAVIASLFYYGV
jgi:hypothetical protein